VALLMTVAGLWTEHPLLIRPATVGIALAQMLWVVDFCVADRGRPRHRHDQLHVQR